MSTRDLIDAIESGNSSAIQQHFQDAIMSRVAERLDTMRIETAKNMFKSSVNENVDHEYLEQVLADNDINSKVMGNTVHVDHDDVEKAQELAKAHGYDHQVQGGLNETWRSVASDFGYDVEQVPNYMKYNHEVGQDVFTVHHTPEGSDYSKEIGRVNSLDQAKELVAQHASKHEPDLRLNEVLSKKAKASEWISDFVHSKDLKFAGKSKEQRIKMALGAYYGVQRNESCGSDKEGKLDETLCGTKKKWGAIKDSMKDSVKK